MWQGNGAVVHSLAGSLVYVLHFISFKAHENTTLQEHLFAIQVQAFLSALATYAVESRTQQTHCRHHAVESRTQ